MIHPLETIKPEIRVLGLDTCRDGKVFGAVVRGGKYLDGVVHFDLDRNGSRQLGKHILATKYYPELRTLMMHDPENHLVMSTLEKVTMLPVISISKERKAGKGYSVFRSQQGTILRKSSLPSSTVDKILSLTWTYGAFPEPARVAHQLASHSVGEVRAGGF
jgi:endonuclease V-like protein UPF0215 family